MEALLTTVWQSPTTHGALSGLLAAFVVDLHAFVTWTSVEDVKKFQWGTALLRWGQGLVTGGLAAAGLGVIG